MPQYHLVRAAITASATFFGGAATLGVVRVNEPGSPWKGRFSLGHAW